MTCQENTDEVHNDFDETENNPVIQENQSTSTEVNVDANQNIPNQNIPDDNVDAIQNIPDELCQQPTKDDSIRITSDFIRRVQQEKDIFPIGKQDMGPRINDNTCKYENIILYLAEIINLECHDRIKCSKYKIGYIIREKMAPSHKSRITHTDPFANFYW